MEPREAARLLAQTQAKAQRSLDFRAPWISLVAAAVALVGFGIVWLNVRDQHPFTGPSPVSLVVFYGLIALRIATVIYARTRARAGVSGHSVTVHRQQALVMGGALLVWYVVLIGIAASGHHNAAFVWSLGLSGTLIALAVVWAGRCAIRKRWREAALTVPVALIAALGALEGPRAMWLINGVGLCLLLVLVAALAHRQQAGAPTDTVHTGT